MIRIYERRKDKHMLTIVKRMTSGLVLVLGITILFSTLVQTQPQRMSVEDRVKILKDSLKLSDEQSSKITKILEDQREEMTTAMNENQGDRDAMRSVMQGLMKKTDDKIKTILNKNQAKKYDKMVQERRARMEQRTQ
jgi:periplasmic protein CpxP/Spy